MSTQKTAGKIWEPPAPPRDPKRRLKKFQLEVPEYFNFGYDVIDEWARRDRNKLAMIWANQHGEERKYTFYEISRLSNQAANLLTKHGIGKGDRVMMMLPRVPEWWIFSVAMAKLGVIQCHVPTLLTAPDLQYRVHFGRFKMVISNLENAEKFDAVYDDCPSLSVRLTIDGSRPGWISYVDEIAYPTRLSMQNVRTPCTIRTKATDPYLLIFTSGTSKFPKLVQHNVAYVFGHRATAELWHGCNHDDLHYTVADTGWGKTLWGHIGEWMLGCCILIYDIRGKFDPDEILPILERYGVTSFCAPPTVYRMLVLLDLRKFDLRQLRECTTAGEAMHTETSRLWEESTGIAVREAYGQTETTCMIANPAGFPPRPGSMGVAMPGWKIEIHDDDGKPLPDGEPGRIAVKVTPHRPTGLFQAYLNDEPENKECFLGDYYYTGDKAYRDADGYFWFVGRSDDIIKSSGYRISPFEVEECLMQHPAVQEVAVVGAPDPLRGARVKAYVVLHDGFKATDSLVRELQNHAKATTAPYKYPREIEFVRTLPKTFSGKVKRDTLRRHAETGEGW